MMRTTTFFLTLVTALVASSGPAFGQTVTSPTPGQVFRAGPDYATDVLQDPWDFNNPEDLAQHPHMYLGWLESASALANGPAAFLGSPGTFTATSNHSNPGLGLLYPGGALTASPGRSGLKYPIDTNQYRVLSFKMATNTPSQLTMHWFTGPYGTAGGGSSTINNTVASNTVYQIDLGSTTWPNQPATGVRLDPTAVNGATVQFDWVRLSAAAMMTVNASNCTGSPAVSVSDGTTTTAVLPAGPLGRQFNYGIFPPGNYTLIVDCGNGAATQPFTINDPPRITVLDPDERGGADYATTVLGNPWDMEDLADVPEVGNLEAVSQPAAPGGGHMFRAANSSNPAYSGDPQVYLLSGPVGGQPLGGANNTTPIASRRYRYLTYTLRVDAPFGTNPALQEGSLARIQWAPGTSMFAGGAATQDILAWPGRNTYTIDLGALTKANLGLDENCSAPCPEWGALSPRFLRIDPHEFGHPGVPFELDNVTLAAADETAVGTAFPIRWRIADADPRGYTIQVYADNDTNFGNGATLIGTSAAPAGDGQFLWTPGAPGDYYIHLRVTEALGATPQVALATSTGFLHVPTPIAPGVLTIASHPSGGTAYAPFSLSGCAYNSAGGADDEVFVYAQQGGTVHYLGYNAAGGLGTIGPAACAGGRPGYQVSNIFGLSGTWTFRVLARNTQTGLIEEVQAQNVTVGLTSAPARNLRIASISGNTVQVAWDAPGQGTLTQYRIEAAGDASFSAFTPIVLAPNVLTVGGTLGNGTYYIRVRTGNNYTSEGPTSNVISFTLPFAPGSGDPPGPPTLHKTQVLANPITLSWSQGPGGAPAQYFLLAGSAPGAANYGTFPMGLTTTVSANAPPGPIYARVVAINNGGQAVSNEINFALAPPPTPTMNAPSISGRNVVLSWTPAAGATSYVCIVRYPGQSAVLLTMPWNSTTLPVPNAPSGTYIVTVVAVNSLGTSTESNPVTVPVP